MKDRARERVKGNDRGGVRSRMIGRGGMVCDLRRGEVVEDKRVGGERFSFLLLLLLLVIILDLRK